MAKKTKAELEIETPDAVGPQVVDGPVTDISKLEKQVHNWVDRGAVVSCEGANHPSHRHFKVRRGATPSQTAYN